MLWYHIWTSDFLPQGNFYYMLCLQFTLMTLNNNTLYFRSSKYDVATQTNIYGNWIKIANDTVLREMIGGKFPKTINAIGTIDFNALEANTIVRYGSSSTKENGYDNASVGAVLTIGLESESVEYTQKYQIAWDSSNNKLWYRNSKYENGSE